MLPESMTKPLLIYPTNICPSPARSNDSITANHSFFMPLTGLGGTAGCIGRGCWVRGAPQFGQKCRHRQHIVYLDYLKPGEFEFGKAEQVEILDPQGPIGFLEVEKITPIILSFICKKCGCQIEARPISVEYLKTIIDRPKTTEIIYV